MNTKMELKRKSVCFNIADPDQKKWFLHAEERTNFSNYVKRLIERDYREKVKGE